MQMYSNSGMAIGKKDKTHSAEFSTNPDDRCKCEVSYAKHMQKIKHESDYNDSLRIKINKIRNEKGLFLFSNQNEFEELVEESGFEDSQLEHFLITYGSDEIVEFKLVKKETIFIFNDIPATTSSYLAEYLSLSNEEIINLSYLIDNKFIKCSHAKAIFLKNDEGLIITYYRLMLLLLFIENYTLINKIYFLLVDMKKMNNFKASIKNLIECIDPSLKKLEVMVEEKIKASSPECK